MKLFTTQNYEKFVLTDGAVYFFPQLDLKA